MAAEPSKARKRQQRSRIADAEPVYGPPPPESLPSIANLGKSHRAAHLDNVTILEAASHLLMAQDWPINCPRFMEALHIAGMDCVSRLHYIRLDHHLLTALVERWSPKTNSFHLPVGEMTVTLQDVSMILGLQVDGPPIVGPIVIGEGKRWHSWPDCCDDLLGHHPVEGMIYHDPRNHRIRSSFNMGQAKSKTCIPLRWLRWNFYRDSYLDLNEIEFYRHVRAYILFMLGCFLLPDTSGSEIHLQFLPLIEDLEIFSSLSLGAAVLAHLYRELNAAISPKRVNIAGCLHLLQVWSWEHLHVGRPTLHAPYPSDFDGLSLGYRWNDDFVRKIPPANLTQYRDELDGLLESQVIWEPYGENIRGVVAEICLRGSDICLCRVPLICWRRVEWHLPDRVLRQFGLLPHPDVAPMEPGFIRVDGRGKGDTDWISFHHAYIAIWENRRAYVVTGGDDIAGHDSAVARYMEWYRSWASVFLSKPPIEPPTTYYPRASTERECRDHILATEDIFRPFFGVEGDSPIQQAVQKYEEICSSFRQRVYISDSRSHEANDDSQPVHFSPSVTHEPSQMEAGPSSYPDVGPEHTQFDSTLPETGPPGQMPYYYQYGSPFYFGGPTFAPPGPMPGTPYYPTQPWVAPSTGIEYYQPHMSQQTSEADAPHQLRDRPIRGPDHYTPGSDAIPRRDRRRRH